MHTVQDWREMPRNAGSTDSTHRQLSTFAVATLTFVLTSAMWLGGVLLFLEPFRDPTTGALTRPTSETTASTTIVVGVEESPRPDYIPQSEDHPIFGDIDRDGVDELGVFRPSTGEFFFYPGRVQGDDYYRMPGSPGE